MNGIWPKRIATAMALLSLLTCGAARPAGAQQGAFAATAGTTEVADAASAGDATANQIIGKLLSENERRRSLLQQYTVVRTYEIRTQEGKLGAQVVVRMEYHAPDQKTFEKTSEQGSGLVRHLVFDRLMESESDSASGRQRQESALTPANYNFQFAGTEDVGAYHCLVFQVVPKREDKYLFAGKIWIDSEDFAVVKIEGRPAKKLSFWVNQADFVREFQKVDGFWLPLRDETRVDVKVYGKRLLIIEHGPYQIAKNAEGGTQPAN